eukprot:5833782-Pleurochrysis_carterae.AAC.1
MEAELEKVAAAWAKADLSAETYAALDKQGLEIADNQERSATGREALKEVCFASINQDLASVLRRAQMLLRNMKAGDDLWPYVIREFKKTPHDERLSKIGGVIKAFQAEVDALTRRQAFAEDAFVSLYRTLDDAPDPVGTLRKAAAELRTAQAAAAENSQLKQTIAEYDREFQSLKNQVSDVSRRLITLPLIPERTSLNFPLHLTLCCWHLSLV